MKNDAFIALLAAIIKSGYIAHPNMDIPSNHELVKQADSLYAEALEVIDDIEDV